MVVKNVLIDMDVDNTIDELMGNVVVKTSATEEHAAVIERSIHTVKERT